MSVDLERVTVSMILTLALGGVGIFLFRGYVSQKWYKSLLIRWHAYIHIAYIRKNLIAHGPEIAES